jgi:hypothetical protein
VQCAAGVFEPAAAVQVAGDRTERHHHAHQADEDRHIGGAADRERGQVERRMTRHHHGVDGAEGEHGDLADVHRPGERGDAARALQQRRLRHAAFPDAAGGVRSA